MSDTIRFYKLKKYNVYKADFMNMQSDNNITFGKNANIAVLYAPNGTGKTSFVDVIDNSGVDVGIEFSCRYKKKVYTKNESLFYVIRDHQGRNIINVKESDYIIGDNIQKEYLLKEELDSTFKKLSTAIIHVNMKKLGFSTKSNMQYELFENQMLAEMCKELIPKATREKDLSSKFITWIKNLTLVEVPNYEDEKLQFLRENYTDKKSLLYKIIQLRGKEISSDPRVYTIGKNNDAIGLIKKYHDSANCVLCESDNYHPEALIHKKQLQNEEILKNLNKESKAILQEIVDQIVATDPYEIKTTMLSLLKEGNITALNDLIFTIEYYLKVNEKLLQNMLVGLFEEYNLATKINTFLTLKKEPPIITEEDLLFVQEVVQNTIGREIKLDRVGDNIKLTLGDTELFGSDFDALHLSTGEQNFVSLAFEFLKAKNRQEEIIVLDDPISSFDSIFKNKIAFSIIKFLKLKNVIILTHNTDLIRLLEHQLQNSFTLYLFNNFDGARNGFVPISANEKDILLGMDKLLKLFTTRNRLDVQDEKVYLISLIPFMRGYANLMGEDKIYKKLSRVMHGYEHTRINITTIYNKLFCKVNNGVKISTSYYTSVGEIISLNITNCNHIVNADKFPLLNNTLYHSICYLYLRLKVERTLVRKFNVNTYGKPMLLGSIIEKALKEENISLDDGKRAVKLYKAKLASKKTLLNEFNHFEGNLNIFQPAIDISDAMLKKEISEVEGILEKIVLLKTS